MASSSQAPALTSGIALVARNGVPFAVQRRLISLAILVLFLAAWEAPIRLGWINPQLLAAPSTILATFWRDLGSGQLATHAKASAFEFVVGYGLAVILAVPFGLMLGASRRLEWALNPYLLGMYATPSQAWLPLLIIALGIGAAPKIVLIVLFTFFVVALNTAVGVKNVSPVLIKVARSFGASAWTLFAKVIVPAALPLIITGLRLGVGRAVIGIFLAEMVGANQGIGFYIMRSGTEFRVDRVFVGVLILVAASVALTEGMRTWGQRLTPWQQRTQL